MLKYYLISILFFILVYKISAEQEMIPGYYIDNNDQKTEVTFEIPIVKFAIGSDIDYSKIQLKIKYDSGNKKKRILKPDEIKEIGFKFQRRKIKLISVENIITKNPLSITPRLFLKLEKIGKINLFVYHQKRTYDMTPARLNSQKLSEVDRLEKLQKDYDRHWLDKTYILQKKDEKPIRPKKAGFKKQMIAYLEGCDHVIKLIQQRKYKLKDILLIVEDYNRTCYKLK